MPGKRGRINVAKIIDRNGKMFSMEGEIGIQSQKSIFPEPGPGSNKSKKTEEKKEEKKKEKGRERSFEKSFFSPEKEKKPGE
jgi:hypothetical protein